MNALGAWRETSTAGQEIGGWAWPRDTWTGVQECGNVECSGRWLPPWRNRKRPVLEGRWGCSRECVLAIAQSVVRRAHGERLHRATGTQRQRIPLGLFMLAQGWITKTQLSRALEAQSGKAGSRIGECLVAECGVSADQVMRALAMQSNCPVFDSVRFDPKVAELVAPKVLIREFGMLPLRISGGSVLQVGFEGGLDSEAVTAMERMSNLKVQGGLLESGLIRETRERLLSGGSVAATLERVSGTDGLAARVASLLEERQPLSSRLVRVNQYFWLRLWLESGTRGEFGSLPRSAEDMWDYVFVPGASA